MSPRWSLRASSPQLPKLGMELKINTMDGELIEVGSSEAARKVILLHGLTGTGSVIKPVAEIQKENGRSLEVRAVSHVIQRLEINTLLRCISGFQAHLAEEPVFQSWGLRRSKNEGRQQYHPPASHLDWRRAECQPLSRRPPAMF